MLNECFGLEKKLTSTNRNANPKISGRTNHTNRFDLSIIR
jgi:hypothetical protein